MKDGLSQHNRLERLKALDTFEPVHNGLEVLLQRAEEIAGFIRYYNLNGEADGYFNVFLDEINQLRTKQKFFHDGTMEPSQAILYTFAKHLKDTIQVFNEKWKAQYISWYINKILQVETIPLYSDYAWLQFNSNVDETINIERGTQFTFSDASVDDKIYYFLDENVQVNKIQVKEMHALYLEKNPDIFPANLFGFPVALHKKTLPTTCNSPLFERKRNKETIHSLGLHITSPSLLLTEGKRNITLLIEAENKQSISVLQQRKMVQLFQLYQKQKPHLSKQNIKEDLQLKLLSTIFYLKISTLQGWEVIKTYTVSYKDNLLKIQFQLNESFPETTACTEEIHACSSEFPGLKIFLNHDAWLYPYAWLKNFFVKRITINAHVEGITKLLFYNDLGEIDTSKPFSPFGINTECGAWFVMGNYEMSIKNVQAMDMKICWHQLPKNEFGLHEYYSEYKTPINNCSFKIRPCYLFDYKWHKTLNAEPFYLFSTLVTDKNGNTEASGRLSDESQIKNILLKNIPPVLVNKENYQYNIQSKSGFYRFVLEEPHVGFGEKHYRQLYTQLLMSKAFLKKGIMLNLPLQPQIERITLSYKSSDEIDLRTCPKTNHTRIHHIYPLGEKQIYPQQDNKPNSFVYNLETDANILFGLENVKGEEQLNFYFEFFPKKEEVFLSNLPVIIWYWGNGYNWERLPDESILRNTTQNFLTNGFVKIYIPAIPEKGFRDDNGLVWLAASVVKNQDYIATIHNLYTNVAKVSKSTNQLEKNCVPNFIINESKNEITGVSNITQITPFMGGQSKETEKQKNLRVSEYATHRQRAVTARDYEQITLQAFPEIAKVKCIFNTQEKKVQLVILPKYVQGMEYEKPIALPELLLKVEEYFTKYTSAFIKNVDAIHPLYEEIMIRCELELNWTNYSNAASRALITKIINQMIAPWQKNLVSPSLGYSIKLQDIYDKIKQLNQVEKIRQFSAIRTIQDANGCFQTKEYTRLNEIITPSLPYSILVPAKEHLFVSQHKKYGVEEMTINENFVIWQKGTEKR